MNVLHVSLLLIMSVCCWYRTRTFTKSANCIHCRPLVFHHSSHSLCAVSYSSSLFISFFSSPFLYCLTMSAECLPKDICSSSPTPFAPTPATRSVPSAVSDAFTADAHSATDPALLQLLAGRWPPAQFAQMHWSVQNWAKHSAGFNIVHNSKGFEHHRDCLRARSSKDAPTNGNSSTQSFRSPHNVLTVSPACRYFVLG